MRGTRCVGSFISVVQDFNYHSPTKLLADNVFCLVCLLTGGITYEHYPCMDLILQGPPGHSSSHYKAPPRGCNPFSLLVTSGGLAQMLVETCSSVESFVLTSDDWLLKHVHWTSRSHASYWNALLFTCYFYICRSLKLHIHFFSFILSFFTVAFTENSLSGLQIMSLIQTTQTSFGS